jgi:threonine dehydratase
MISSQLLRVKLFYYKDEISFSLMTLLEKEKTMAEGAGAAALAGLLSHKLKFTKKNVGVVISGGNIDVSLIRNIIGRGLVKSGRLARVKVEVPDVPGSLAKLLNILAELGANVKDITHDRAFFNITPGNTIPIVTIETKGIDHINLIRERLESETFFKNFELVSTEDILGNHLKKII